MNKEYVVQTQPKRVAEALDKMSSDLSFIIDTSSADYIYYGWAPVGRLTETSAAIWIIMRVAVSSSVFSFGWAAGDTKNDNVWNDRASLSYS